MSPALNTTNLDKFLKSIGRDPSYIDLEVNPYLVTIVIIQKVYYLLIFIPSLQANPSVGKDQPPDLAGLVPSGSAFVPDTPEKTSSCPGSNENQGVADKKSKAAAGSILSLYLCRTKR